jgi:hypothetical protein
MKPNRKQIKSAAARPALRQVNGRDATRDFWRGRSLWRSLSSAALSGGPLLKRLHD